MAKNQQEWEEGFREAVAFSCNKKENRLNQLLAPRYVDCSFQEQTVTVAFDIQEWEWNPRAELHGGAIAAMFDLALGLAARGASGALQIATTDMSISYLRRVDGDDTVLMNIKIRKNGSQMIRLSGEACSQKTGKPVAMVQSSYMVLT